ncbi:hypothetical protein COJ00_27050 [Priestia megaterium]|uniref:hypothetical protein n=1 Tax=Priestia megaterium TaxID=1404 RepID=UPI000BF2A15A|nr:hypothetical protein [Priestia megaterium]PFJ40190.1 hypothetical protein COJ00_27050 [Priestia megaterium]
MDFNKELDFTVEKLTEEQFRRYVVNYSKENFEDFCHRFQKIFYPNYTATKSWGKQGDDSQDGIISERERVAIYGPEIIPVSIDEVNDFNDRITNKLENDFEKMIRKHPNIEKMIFICKIDKESPKITHKIKELYTETKQREILADMYEKRLSNKLIEIDFIDLTDMFSKLNSISVDYLDYLFNRTLKFERMISNYSKETDEPAFIRDILNEIESLLSNRDLNIDVILYKLNQFIDIVSVKIDRDFRKYNTFTSISIPEDIPYIPYVICGAMNSSGKFVYECEFDVPVPLRDERKIRIPFTPIGLIFTLLDFKKCILKRTVAKSTYRLTYKRFFYSLIYSLSRSSRLYPKKSKATRYIIVRRRYKKEIDSLNNLEKTVLYPCF